MLIAAAVILSMAFLSLHLLRFKRFSWVYGPQIMNPELHKHILRLLETGNYSRLEKLYGHIQDVPAGVTAKALFDNRHNPDELQKIADAYVEKCEKIKRRLSKKITGKEAIFYLVNIFLFGGTLYLDGMQTGWVVAPITIATILILVAIFFADVMKSVLHQGCEESLEKLPELLEALSKAK